MTGTGAWKEAYGKAVEYVSKMTLEEKVILTSGIPTPNGCVGWVPAIKRIGFPGLCTDDAGNGLRNADFVNSWPSGVHVGASWNRNLSYQRAFGMGNEFKRKGVNLLLGPVVGPMGRIVQGGRNWEGIAVDPYLAGQLVSVTVSGHQDAGVMASTKHYIANEQEMYRWPRDGIEAISSNIDDRTIHEFYLWPFQDAVKAGTVNIMCSYQRLNNSYACHNSKSLNGLLKTELGFQGFVVTDWRAQHAGVAPALAGLDMAMPTHEGFWGEKLVEAVNNGSVPESRVTDMATRIIASWFKLGQDKTFTSPGTGRPHSILDPHPAIDARLGYSRKALFDGAIEGHVLVKNIKNALPLKSPRMMSIFGYSAKSPDILNPGQWISFGDPIDPAFYASAIAPNGTMVSGGGAGATSPSNLISPFEALKMRAYEEGTAVFWDLVNAEPEVDPTSDVCLVFGNAWAAEKFDRPNLHDDYTDGLVKHVASKCPNTVVILHNSGVRLVDQFADNENVTAIIFGHLPGQDSGPAITSILFGDVNPSGKLPYTVARNESDYFSAGPDLPAGPFQIYPQSNFSEGVFVDYRHFDKHNIEPRYEFGFGLSYTTFNYSDLDVSRVDSANTDEFPTGPVVEGGQRDLWDLLYTVTVKLGNSGDRAGQEVAQLYVRIPQAEAPVRQLRGFDKVHVEPSQSVLVTFSLTRRDLSYWDVVHQKWRLPRGEFTVFVGSSSRELPMEGTFVV
ncbi:hypothetical protein TD95_001324 [Thielaviopsis punctulata]|uniref:beta-glucosidase n=1 Tax=Thielaviopsis punctulata TaxID=72032 RepID=A0A0F4ZLD8_9PEZI|nr:hypothetical protein TD95_001324 [Thielaviopsis punctulata]